MRISFWRLMANRVRTGDELLDVVENKNPGDRVVLRIIREGREVDLKVTLGVAD